MLCSLDLLPAIHEIYMKSGSLEAESRNHYDIDVFTVISCLRLWYSNHYLGIVLTNVHSQKVHH